jgi:hypothetical protein
MIKKTLSRNFLRKHEKVTLIENKLIKTINSAGLWRGLLKLINLLRKKLFFASTKKVKMRKWSRAQRLVAYEVGEQSNLQNRRLFILPVWVSVVTRTSSDLVWRRPVRNEASRAPHATTHLADGGEITMLGAIISFLDLRKISNYTRSTRTPSDLKTLATATWIT